MSNLEELLKSCTVKITIPSLINRWGTGFFVAPDLILTCEHVVEGESVQVDWDRTTNWVQAKVERAIQNPYDLALLRFTPPVGAHPPCVYLDETVLSRDPLHLFGYPDEGDPWGEPRNFNCDGITGSEISILFNLGQVRPGMSGSPLLNQRTGKVCGIVKFTRDRSSNLGGGGILTRVILEQFPQLRDQQKHFHLQDKRWRNLLDHKNEALEKYLQDSIQRQPDQKIPSSPDNTQISLRQLYVPLEIRELKEDGTFNLKSVESITWVKGLLRENRDEIILIQGDSGQGKTAFCKIFADEICREIDLDYIPVLIRLQDLRSTKDTLTETLQLCLQAYPFFRENSNWLTDINRKFLVILDGFDELSLPSEEIEDFIDQIIHFQRNSHNQFLISGRSLLNKEIEDVFGGYDNIITGQLQLMDPALQKKWIDKWSLAVSGKKDVGEEFKSFLHGRQDEGKRTGCPEDIKIELAGEPLSLHLLAALFREKEISEQDFSGSDGAEGRIKIYQKALSRALEKVIRSRSYKRLKDRISPETLEKILWEVALCFIQSNGEPVSFSAITQRFKESPAISNSSHEPTSKEEFSSALEKVISKLLTNFYIRSEQHSSLRFVHKSFGEFLFAKKLKHNMLAWIKTENNQEEDACANIYKIIGYGSLSAEISRYFVILLAQEENSTSNFSKLFLRLYRFYWNWCDDCCLDDSSNLLKTIKGNGGSFRHRDIYVGLNVIILLLELYRYSQSIVSLKNEIQFNLCEKEDESPSRDDEKLLRIIGYSYFLKKQSQEYSAGRSFVDILGKHLCGINLSGVNLQGVDLSGADLRQTILEKADLSRTILNGADLRNSNFNGTILRGCDLSNATLGNTAFIDADLTGANLENLDLTRSNTLPETGNLLESEINLDNLKGVKLDFANLTGATLLGIKLSGGSLTNLNLDNFDFRNSDLSNSNLSHTSFRGSDFRNSDLSNSNLSNTTFRSADLRNAVLSGTNLCNAIFRESNLKNVVFSVSSEESENLDEGDFNHSDFSKANLQEADFEGSDLTGVNFEGANLRSANLKDTLLEGAILSGANLSEANLEGANLGNADLRGVNLQGANLEGVILKGLKYNLLAASTFLSHSSSEKALAAEVATQLSRRGVLAWLEKSEMALGSLDFALEEAIQSNVTISVFLSGAALTSSWSTDELHKVIEVDKSNKHLFPVYLNDPVKLVKANYLLQTRFLDRNGDHVIEPYFLDENAPADPDPDAVASAIANIVYRRSIPEDWSEIAIVVDQRGYGLRRGSPVLPANFISLDIPTLTFRPNSGLREPRELLTGSEWEDMVTKMTTGLSTAIGTVRGGIRKVRVLGNAQTGLMWAIGNHFDRTTTAELYVYGKDGLPITNKGQVRHTLLLGGDHDRAKLLPTTSSNLSDEQSQIALGIGSEKRYSQAVQQSAPQLPLFWIDEPGFIADSEQAMRLVADIVASVERLRREHDVRELTLFWTTANHVAVLAAANLTPHVIPAIKFMEWDHANSEYVHLPMPEK